MTPSDDKVVSTPFGDLKLETATSLWICQNAIHEFEIAIGGGAAEPSESAIMFAAQLLPLMEQLAHAARQHLDLFVKTSEFDSDGEWFLEGLLLNAPPVMSPNHFALSFTHPGDVYGYWTVVFQRFGEREQKLLKGIACPISFQREQQ